jgi:magnesium-transporting ATPase (P-type)
VVSYVTEDMKATIVIASMVLLSTLLRFVQEGRSNRAAARLKAMVSSTATVLRRNGGPHASRRRGPRRPAQRLRPAGASLEVPLRELVPGDIVVLSAGDMIPADCRLLSAKDLFVSQAAMTGESCRWKSAPTRAPAWRRRAGAGNLLFMGTNVVSGSAWPWCCHRQPHLFRHAGHAGHARTARPPPSSRRQQRQLAADPLRGRDGARGAASTATPRATGPRPSCSRCRWPWA